MSWNPIPNPPTVPEYMNADYVGMEQRLAAAVGLVDEASQEVVAEDDKHYATIRTYKTPLKLTRVPDCGHKFVPEQEPRHRNCEACWFTFFQVHGEVTKTADELFKAAGVEAIQQLRGKKFTKHFLRFMGALAQWKSMADDAKATTETKVEDEQSTTGVGSSNQDAIDTANYIKAKRKELRIDDPLSDPIYPIGGGSLSD